MDKEFNDIMFYDGLLSYKYMRVNIKPQWTFICRKTPHS